MPPLNVDDWLDILSNRYRRKILRLCSIRPCYAQEIARLLDLTPAAVIKHIQELEKRNLIVKREEPRSEGGKNIQYYYVPFRPRFNFNLASNDLIEIEISDESDKTVPETHSRSKLVSRNTFNNDEITSMKKNFEILVKYEKEKLDVFAKLQKIQFEQEHHFRSMQLKSNSHQRILYKIVRFLIDRYGFTKSFSNHDLMEGLGIDNDSVDEIIQILAIDLNIIKEILPGSESSVQMWKLNVIETENNMHYS